MLTRFLLMHIYAVSSFLFLQTHSILKVRPSLPRQHLRSVGHRLGSWDVLPLHGPWQAVSGPGVEADPHRPLGAPSAFRHSKVAPTRVR